MTTSSAVRRTLIIVLALNAAVTVIKLVIGLHTGVITVVGAALESALDLLNNFIALTVVAIANREPDAEHPYGHAKFESLGMLAVVSLWVSSHVSRLDGVLAIVVAVIIAWTGYQILRASIPVLVDERAVEADEIRAAAATVPGVREVREIRSRATGAKSFAEVTIAVSGASSVEEAHALADAVEQAVAERLGGGQVTVHVEPV